MEGNYLKALKIFLTLLFLTVFILSIICWKATEVALGADTRTSAINAKNSSKGLVVVALISSVANLVLAYFL